MAIDKMVVNHADSLHEGVNDCRPAKPKATRFQVF